MTLEIQEGETYDPGDDTFLLLRAALKEVKPTDCVLEVGCGRAVISGEVAKIARRVIAVDINPHAVRIAKNKGLEAVRTDLFKGLKGRFDLVLFNPPYLPTSYEEKVDGWINYAYDGGPTGRDTIDRFLEGLKDHLKTEGRALLLVSSADGIEEVLSKASAEGFEAFETDDGPEKFFFEQLYVFKLRIAFQGRPSRTTSINY